MAGLVASAAALLQQAVLDVRAAAEGLLVFLNHAPRQCLA